MKKFLFALCVCLLAVPAMAEPFYTTSHYDAVQLGDTHGAVTAILGAPSEINYETEDGEICYLWNGDGGSVITVTYRDGFVISKWEVGVEPPFHAL